MQKKVTCVYTDKKISTASLIIAEIAYACVRIFTTMPKICWLSYLSILALRHLFYCSIIASYVSLLAKSASILFIASCVPNELYLSCPAAESESFQCNLSDIGFAPLNFLPLPLKSFSQFLNLCQSR